MPAILAGFHIPAGQSARSILSNILLKQKADQKHNAAPIKPNVGAFMAITGYPSQIVDALSQHNITLSRLPVLDLKERGESETGDIDFIKEPEMIFPLMQFTDIQGRKGLAFHLHGKVDTVAVAIMNS